MDREVKLYLISGALAQVTIDYLAQRPFREVAELVSALTGLQEAPVPENGAVDKETGREIVEAVSEKVDVDTG